MDTDTTSSTGLTPAAETDTDTSGEAYDVVGIGPGVVGENVTDRVTRGGLCTAIVSGRTSSAVNAPTVQRPAVHCRRRAPVVPAGPGWSRPSPSDEERSPLLAERGDALSLVERLL